MSSLPRPRRSAAFRVLLAAAFWLISIPVLARAADDAWPAVPRRLPPAGVDIGDAARGEIRDGLAKLQARLKPLVERNSSDAADVLIYEKAVRYALQFNEFWKPEQSKVALSALKAANERLDAMEAG